MSGIFTLTPAPMWSRPISVGCAARSTKASRRNLSTQCAGQAIASVALPRLLRTSSFRLTLLYAGLFGASVLILFGVIYWATDIYMTGSLDADIDSDLAELDDTFRTGGISSLASLIRERVRQSPNGPMHYLLEHADGQII